MRRLRNPQAALNLPTLTLEGSLFLPDQLEKAALGKSAIGQTEADYGIPKGLKLKDEYSRAFQIACAQWKHFAAQLERADVDVAVLTHTFVTELLRDAFGYAVQPCTGLTVGDRHYPASLMAGSVPVVVAPHTLALHESDPRFAIAGSGSRKKSAFMLMQELLNASPDHLWGLACNGKQLRLLRDAATLTRPSFLEVDLADLLGGQRYAEFANVWRLLHASRATFPVGEGPGESGAPSNCIWEKWRAAGQAEGTRVREGLRQGVTDALLTLGEGFIQHPANDALRTALHTGALSKSDYFGELLRLVYRLIFIFSLEERVNENGERLIHPADDSPEALAARRAYAEGYALERLRELCLKRRARNRFEDLWQALRIVFRGLNVGERRLALPALGGLFAPDQCPALDAASLDNAHLLAALQNLRWASHNGALAPVDYRNMGPEELGSVYEGLLEFDPRPDPLQRTFELVNTAGNDRKTSGSYYTPDALVQELIKSALDPVIEQRLAERPESPVEALLAIRVIDPACGSGHFLLAAARRLAEKLAQLRAVEGEQTEHDFRHALREVVGRCIFGVDRNPMAIELARTALWLEGFEEGRPLGFLNHHLQVGDALLGLTDLKALERGIAKDAFKPLSGDDKEVCKRLAKLNAAALKDLEKKRNARAFGQLDVASASGSGLSELRAIEDLPENTTQEVAAKEEAYRVFWEQARSSRLALAADVLIGAYLLPKSENGEAGTPTSATLYLTLLGDALPAAQQPALIAAQTACREARVLHWPLAFPQVFAGGGFDCVLGNPPWERIKLQEEEFFASRHRDVAAAKNKAERSQRIRWLAEGMLARHLSPQHEHPPHEGEAERRLYAEFIQARRTAEAASVFMHVKGEDGGRYPLTGIGDVNTYALFAETINQITHASGRAGFIVPTGIATDDSTKAYFGEITQKGRLVSLFDIENREKLFADVDSRMKFCLLTLGEARQAEFVCFATQVNHLDDPRRRFTLTPEEFRLINPNTLTCPVFRSERDAELTKKLYNTAPVLIEETREASADGEVILGSNPWGIRFHTRLFHMAEDSHLFLDQPTNDSSPLYEAKMVHQFDHRWATYGLDGEVRDLTDSEKENPEVSVSPRYWVSTNELENRLQENNWTKEWLLGWRDICRSTDMRTLISSVIPKAAVGDKYLLMFSQESPRRIAALLGNLNALVCDFVARQKVGGTSLKLFTIRQLPILPPDRYTEDAMHFIVPRVLELTYTAYDLTPWARDLGYSGPPFVFHRERRAVLRAELDAWYARAFGLTRDELRYILDPADVMGADYPSETFRVLKSNEERAFGEYRTGELVLREYDRMAAAEAKGVPYTSLLNPPPGQQALASYSSHGIIRDEADARLAGLLLTMIRQLGRLPRRQLMDALVMAGRPSSLAGYTEVADIELIAAYQGDHPGIFDASRLAGERIHTLLSHFETRRLIRIDAHANQLLAVDGADMPESIVDGDTGRVATVLIQAAIKASFSSGATATDEGQTADTSVKRA